MNQDWTIQHRSHQCGVTGRPFEEGEYFYTMLFDERTGYRREDLCEAAFKDRPADAPVPFSLWRMKYAPPAPPTPEPLGKQTAEDLLRRYMEEDTPQNTNARWLLAVMLERKRILKEIESKRGESGQLTRIYEHAKTGEIFVVPDPQLRMDQIEALQVELSPMLMGAPVEIPAEVPAEAPVEQEAEKPGQESPPVAG
jgi:hypothetical protein